MKLTDTHCHLYLEQFEEDISEIYQRAVNAGISKIYLPSIDWNSRQQMEKLSHAEIEFFKMAGIHPCDVQHNFPLDEQKLFDLCVSDKIIAVGETGLDYYWSTDHVEEQKDSLHTHCKVAKSTHKPIVLHNRESTTDLLDIIEEEQDGSLKGVWHCFTGTLDEGKRALDLGFYLGLGGVATFKNGGIDKFITELPLNRIVLETDAPFLSPVPHRGKRNEPSYVRLVAEKLATLFDIPLEEIADITSENAEQLFHGNTQSS